MDLIDASILVISMDDLSQSAIEIAKKSNFLGIKYLSITKDLQVYTNYLSEDHIVIDTLGPKQSKLSRLLRDNDIIFIIQTLDSNSNTKSLSYISKLARELNIVTVALILVPLVMDDHERPVYKQYSINHLHEDVDALLLFQEMDLLWGVNNQLFSNPEGFARLIQKQLSVLHRFILPKGTGAIIIDVNDTKYILRSSGFNLFAMGAGDTSKTALKNLSLNLAGRSFKEAQNLLIYVRCHEDCSLFEVTEIVNEISDQTGIIEPDLIFGCEGNAKLEERFEISVIANKFRKLDSVIQTVRLNLPAITGILDNMKDNYEIPALMRYKSLN